MAASRPICRSPAIAAVRSCTARRRRRDHLEVRLEQVVADHDPWARQRREVVDGHQLDLEPLRLEPQRLVRPEAGDEVDVAVQKALDLVELRVRANGDVVGGQPAGVEQCEQRVPRRTELPRRPDAQAGQACRRVGNDVRRPDQTGQYELESIRPIPYRPNPTGAPDFWRCAHYHLVAVCPGYQPLITEIHFQGDPKKNDPMFRVENAINVEERTVNGKVFQTGVFDVVLESEPASK